MQITEIKKISEYLKKCRKLPVGIGTTAICFLTKDNKVLKLYLNTSNRRAIFNNYDSFIEHMSEVGKYANDTYIAPDELLVQDGKCVAYLYPYIQGRTLKHINLFTKVDTLFLENYSKLEEDTQKFSESGFLQDDLHEKNIVYNGSYHIIDLDVTPNLVADVDLYETNMQKINKAIIDSLFRENDFTIMKFHNDELQKLYYEAIHKNHEAIRELFRAFNYYYPKADSVFDLKAKKHRYMMSKDNDYKFRRLL